MSTSPSLRLSLRRKRSTRPGENNGSPAVKKNSPKVPEAKKEPPSTPKTHSSRRANKATRSVRSSPRLNRTKSSEKSDNEEKNLHTPVSVNWRHAGAGEDSLRQPSPDMPFLSSQLCSTQECEVVWDCDSPGFSREDLKRMHSGGEMEAPERAVVVIQAPHRQLFPHTRTRLSRSSSSGNTTAQLNDLLDLLSKKENEGKTRKASEDSSYSLHKTLQHIIPPKDSPSEDTSSSESVVLPRALGESSSQPFEVPGVSSPKACHQTSIPSDCDDSFWGDDLNLGLCEINDSVLAQCDGGGSSSEGVAVGVGKGEVGKSKLLSENAEISNVSSDIFDDDLFSESVILSTQAVEEAMTTNDTNYSSAKDLKGQQHDGNNRNINSVKNNSRNNNKSEVNKLATSNLNTNTRILSKVNTYQKNSSSDSPPRRQVRRSFRFGPSPTDRAKSGPSSPRTLPAPPDNQRHIRTKQTSSELKKTNLMPVFGIEKPSNMQKTSVSNSVHNRLSESHNVRVQATDLPSVRKPLFKSNDTKAEDMRNRSSNAQGSRGPLLRSQSIGNARLATSSPVGRRSNSSMELDSCQDLEDDEFFKSLLSMLPEEEGGISDNSSVPLSPITTENKSRGSHARGKSLGYGRLAVGKNVHEIRGRNNRERDTSNASVGNVNNGSVRTLLVGQVNQRPGVMNAKVKYSGQRPTPNVQQGRPNVMNYSVPKTKPLDTREQNAGESKQQQSNDTFDDGLFEGDVLSLINEVESQFGSQNAAVEPSPSPQSQPQAQCTQDEIARKKAAALQRREEKRRQQCR